MSLANHVLDFTIYKMADKDANANLEFFVGNDYLISLLEQFYSDEEALFEYCQAISTDNEGAEKLYNKVIELVEYCQYTMGDDDFINSNIESNSYSDGDTGHHTVYESSCSDVYDAVERISRLF